VFSFHREDRKENLLNFACFASSQFKLAFFRFKTLLFDKLLVTGEMPLGTAD
jgi:hypothetical protein